MTTIKKQSLFLRNVLSIRDNSTSLATNGFAVSIFPNFRFAPQTQDLIYIFINVAQRDCNEKPKSFLRHVLSFRDNSKSFSRNGFPVSNLVNFGFAPQSKILIYIFINVAQRDCNHKAKSLFISCSYFSR